MIVKNFNFIAQLSTQLTGGLLRDLTQNLEAAVPQLSLALDFLRPHVRALGLRVAKLSKDNVELVLPAKFRNQSQDGHVLEGALVMAACETAKWLWLQNQPAAGFCQNIKKIQLECLKPLEGTLRLRMEMSEVARETVFLELAKMKKSEHQDLILIYDKDEQLVAQVEILSEFTLTPSLEWK
jgi:acyl-coenzyme A thioesterase PaaI-like protein